MILSAEHYLLITTSKYFLKPILRRYLFIYFFSSKDKKREMYKINQSIKYIIRTVVFSCDCFPAFYYYYYFRT